MIELSRAGYGDLPGLLALYCQLHDAPPPPQEQMEPVWAAMLDDPNHYVLLLREDGVAVSSCVLLVVPNLTHGGRPYGLIENVITLRARRGLGYGRRVLDYARAIAVGCGCYKLMLMTGRKTQETLDFYQGAGYNSGDKTAFVQWLSPSF